jgi:hypothetical protein
MRHEGTRLYNLFHTGIQTFGWGGHLATSFLVTAALRRLVVLSTCNRINVCEA